MNKILQAKLTAENEKATIEFLQYKLLLKMFTKYGVTDFSSLANEITSADLQYWLENGIEVQNVPFYIELSPSLKTGATPSIFPKRTITEYDEEGNETGTRILKIGEYFRYHELQGRFFIELISDPKNDPTKAIGTISVEDYLSVSQIQKILDTFTTAILNSYTSKEFKAVMAELNTIEE